MVPKSQLYHMHSEVEQDPERVEIILDEIKKYMEAACIFGLPPIIRGRTTNFKVINFSSCLFVELDYRLI